MKVEEIIFKSKTWNSLKGRIPRPLRSALSSSLLQVKRWISSLECIWNSRIYVQNWSVSVIRELFLPKGRYIQYRLKSYGAEPLLLTIRAKSYDKFVVQEICTDNYGIALENLKTQTLGDASPKMPTVIDAGAHIGVFATKVMKEFPSARVLCVEPITENLKLLNKNLEDNQFSKNVMVIPGALSNREGTTTIYARKEHSAGFNLYMPTEIQYTVPSLTLESILRDYQISHCDLLKLDIEGGEYEVLRGASKQVLDRIESIVMEYHPFPKETADINGLATFLNQHGYSTNFYASKMLYATKKSKI